jgi:hypothetical protein
VGRGAGPARGGAYKKRKAGREVAWRGAVVEASPAPPVVAYACCDSRAPNKHSPRLQPPRACAKAKVNARVAKPPWQPRDDEHSRERGRGPLLLAEGGGGGSPTEGVLKKNRSALNIHCP